MTNDGSRGRRRLRRLAYLLLALVALFYAGGGLYFAGLIRTDGLEARLPSIG